MGIYGFQIKKAILHLQSELNFMERLFYNSRREECRELAENWSQ